MNDKIYKCIGASNHAKSKRQPYDYYATEPKAAKLLLLAEPDLDIIWECACGEGHLADVFFDARKLALATDLIDRGYPLMNKTLDFLSNDNKGYWHGDIVTNPPYKFAQLFVEKAMELLRGKHKLCLFLKLTFLEGKARKEMFAKYPPKTIYVCSSRIPCAKNGNFSKHQSSAVAYAWFVWQKDFYGCPSVRWIN